MLNILDSGLCTSYLGTDTGIPSKLAFLVALAIRVIQIGVPVLLIIWGMLDLGKAVMAQKEDEIKKGTNTFIKRLVAAVIVFFVITIVRLLVGLFADNNDTNGADKKSQSLWDCVDEIIKCDKSNCSD